MVKALLPDRASHADSSGLIVKAGGITVFLPDCSIIHLLPAFGGWIWYFGKENDIRMVLAQRLVLPHWYNQSTARSGDSTGVPLVDRVRLDSSASATLLSRETTAFTVLIDHVPGHTSLGHFDN